MMGLILGSFAAIAGAQTAPKIASALPTDADWDRTVMVKSGLIMDERSGKVLWERDADRPMYPASTTKIMTALLLLEHSQPGQIITAHPAAAKVGESSMNIRPGERIPVKDMLYALMLRSANDGCVAVAYHVAGSLPAFIELMNARAQELGATNTRFNNPHGLNDTAHLTTARDLALMGREAMRYPLFRDIVRTKSVTIRRSINQGDRFIKSRNKWLFKDASADGIKTGYTRPAGHCYVGSAQRNGFRVITSLLNSPQWQEDHRQMLAYAFANYRIGKSVRPGERYVETPVVINGTPVPVAFPRAHHALVRQEEPAPFTELALNGNATLPLQRGDSVGKLIVTDEDGFRQEWPLVAAEDVAAPPPLARITTRPDATWLLWLGGATAAYVVVKRRGRKRFGI